MSDFLVGALASLLLATVLAMLGLAIYDMRRDR